MLRLLAFKGDRPSKCGQNQLMTRKLSAYFNDYAEFHRTKGNQLTHMVGVPAIVISLLGLLSLVTFGNASMETWLLRPDLGVVLFLLGSVFYFSIDWKIALPFTLVMCGMYFMGRALPLSALIALQIGGWIVQYIGHIKYEKKSPAFYQNVRHLLIGPLWVFAKIVGYAKTEYR